MAGLSMICKLYGKIKVKGNNGNEVTWLYDYAKDEARLQSEMSKDEIIASNIAKRNRIKNSMDKLSKDAGHG